MPVVHVYISSFVCADLYKAVHISCILWYAFIKVVDFWPRHLFIFIWGLMPVCCQSSQWQQISTYVRRGNFNYEKYQTSEDSYNINNYGYYSIWNYSIYGNNLPYKIYNRNILCWLRYDTGVDCFTSFWY